MDDGQVLGKIRSLAEDEHALRSSLGHGEAAPADVERLRRIEEELDQCWDLLRQRRARRSPGDDPDAAAARPVPQVESYLQ